MSYYAEILKDVSYDPYFEVKFTYTGDGVNIQSGHAVIIRKTPKAEITFDPDTEEVIQHKDKAKIELELLNTIIQFLLAKHKIR